MKHSGRNSEKNFGRNFGEIHVGTPEEFLRGTSEEISGGNIGGIQEESAAEIP